MQHREATLSDRKPKQRHSPAPKLLLLMLLVGTAGCEAVPPAAPARTPAAHERATLPAPPEVQIELVPPTHAPPQVSVEITSAEPAAQPSVDTVFVYLRALAAGDAPHMLDSYATTPTFDDGDTAWTYDNALALLALLARGQQADLATARALADAFVYAQAHDPEFADGRLRDAYHASSFVRADGKVNVDRGGSATGNMAWAIIALVGAWERLGDDTYLTAAHRLGQWVFDHTNDKRGDGGYTGGLADDGSRLLWKATEHNVDVYAAFVRLHQATGEHVWLARAMSAKRLLRTLWSDEGGFFWTGTTGDGVTVNQKPIPEDAQSWALLVLGETERYGRGVAWAEATLYEAACPGSGAVGGYRFSNTGSGCWWEGTAHMALVWRVAGESDRAEALLWSLRSVRLPNAETGGEAVPAATGVDAATGYGWSYPAQVHHLGATAWYLFAELGHNPFWGRSTTDPIPFVGLYEASNLSPPP